MITIEEIKQYINETIPQLTYRAGDDDLIPLNLIIVGLCNIAIIYHLAHGVIKNLSRGGEGFSWDLVSKPFLYMVLVAAFPLLNEFIGDASTYVASYVEDGQQSLSNKTNEFMASFDDSVKNVYQAIRDKTDYLKGEQSWYEAEVLVNLEVMDEHILIGAIQALFWAFSYIDSFLLICFFIVSKIWLYLVAIGGPIALVVSLYSGGHTGLINWAKTYLSVSLWLPVGGIVIHLLNGIMTKIVVNVVKPFLDKPFNQGELIDVTSWELIKTLMLVSIMLFVFIALKLIMLGKVPQIITGWVGGGSSAGGGLAMAFFAVSAVKNAGSSVTSAATGVATGGKSMIASKLKKNG